MGVLSRFESDGTLYSGVPPPSFSIRSALDVCSSVGEAEDAELEDEGSQSLGK